MGSDLFCGCGTDTVGGRTDPDVGTNFYCIIKEVSVSEIQYHRELLNTW